MKIKEVLKNFFKFIYNVLSTILFVTSLILIFCIAAVLLMNLDFSRSSSILFLIVLLCIIGYLAYNKYAVIRKGKKNSVLFFIGEIFKVVAVFYLYGFIISLIKQPGPIIQKIEEADETVVLYTDSSKASVKKYYKSRQTWYDFNRNRHSLDFKVNYFDVEKSTRNRELSRIRDFRKLVKTETDSKTGQRQLTYAFSWSKFYKKLVEHDKSLVEELALEFNTYKAKNKLNRKQFAELMITAIQDIPYNLVLTEPCKTNESKPCIGNVKFGLFAPAEYVANLRGDCDTRTVLLFTLLSRFNYDVAILNSTEYRHSVLGLHIPSTGKYKTLRQKKYYFVETTARHCPIGYLAREFSNINYWDFTLVHNQKS